MPESSFGEGSPYACVIFDFSIESIFSQNLLINYFFQFDFVQKLTNQFFLFDFFQKFKNQLFSNLIFPQKLLINFFLFQKPQFIDFRYRLNGIFVSFC